MEVCLVLKRSSKAKQLKASANILEEREVEDSRRTRILTRFTARPKLMTNGKKFESVMGQ